MDDQLSLEKIASRLGCEETALTQVIQKIKQEFGVDRIGEVREIPEAILLRHGIPAGFCQFLHGTLGDMALGSEGSDVSSEGLDGVEEGVEEGVEQYLDSDSELGPEGFSGQKSTGNGIVSNNSITTSSGLSSVEHRIKYDTRSGDHLGGDGELQGEGKLQGDIGFTEHGGLPRELSSGSDGFTTSPSPLYLSESTSVGKKTKRKRNRKTGGSDSCIRTANGELNEVEKFLWNHGFDNGMTPLEIRFCIRRIVNDNWFTTVDCLKRLPLDQWNRLGIQNVFLLGKLQKAILRGEEGVQQAPAYDIVEVLLILAKRLGISETKINSLLPRLGGIKTMSDLEELSKQEFEALGLPLALANELETIRQRPERVPETELEDDLPESETWEEPGVQEFIQRVGKLYKHSENETKLIKQILIEEHWLTSLSKMRLLEDHHWEEFYLSRSLVHHLRVSLYEPLALKMTAVATESPPIDLFPCDVSFAVDQLGDEIEAGDLPVIARSFTRLFEFLIAEPREASRRSLRKLNPNFQRAAKYPSVPVLLFSLGYVDYVSHFLLPVNYIKRIETAHARLLELVVLNAGRKADDSKLSSYFSFSSFSPSPVANSPIVKSTSKAWNQARKYISSVVPVS